MSCFEDPSSNPKIACTFFLCMPALISRFVKCKWCQPSSERLITAELGEVIELSIRNVGPMIFRFKKMSFPFHIW